MRLAAQERQAHEAAMRSRSPGGRWARCPASRAQIPRADTMAAISEMARLIRATTARRSRSLETERVWRTNRIGRSVGMQFSMSNLRKLAHAAAGMQVLHAGSPYLF